MNDQDRPGERGRVVNRFMPNRMQEEWDRVKHFLKSEWPRLTEVDLEEIHGEYDRLIDRIRELYHTGASIMLEAEVKGKLQRFLNQIGE